ncbi:MAG: hypothetical protein Q9162_002467 [Coniocarpon cinnabarinum]
MFSISALSLGGNNNDRTAVTAGTPSRPQETYIDRRVHEEHQPPPDERPGIPKPDETSDPGADEKGIEQTSSSSEDDEKAELARRDNEVHQLARRYTQESTRSGVTKKSGRTGSSTSLATAGVAGDDPFHGKDDSVLDPHSANFKPRVWAKSLLNLQSRDPEKYKSRTAGYSFQNLNAHGFGSATDYQKSVGNVLLDIVGLARKALRLDKPRRIDILRNLEGVVQPGEMLVVLGPPGSGCSTFLKTVAGETHGFFLENGSELNYQGIAPKQMHKNFRGEAIYTAEVDVHFPMLSVGDTLAFAAKARSPRSVPGGLSRSAYSRFMRDVIMAVFGISHTINTRVGNDFVRGVSGGERKRVTIAEAALSSAPLQCWDNSTRGLDSANAIEFCKTLRMSSDMIGTTSNVSIYQGPQSAYDQFDKVLVLYEGRQIFFGRCDEARDYFVNIGFKCPDRQTTPDFLTSMTSPQERVVREGFLDQVPRTPDEFAEVWKKSNARASVMAEIEQFNKDYPVGGESLAQFKDSRRAQQAKNQRINSPYTLSYTGQVMLCLERGFQRLRGDPSLTFTQLFGNFIMALIIGSVFYNLDGTTSSFFQRGALLFFAVLLNAFGSMLEILTLYAQRPIVEKHSRYALYHPSCEAFASMLTDMPYKIMNAITFNLALYFLTNLRREPGAFFFYLLISFTATLVMSMLFRSIAAVSRSLVGALAPTAVLLLALVIYTGFALPVPYMLGWARWINYLDPIAYAFESLMVNEFAGRDFRCDQFFPTGPQYANLQGVQRSCTAVGSVPGSDIVSGTTYIGSAYSYDPSHRWRNYGILLLFMFGLMALYLTASELITEKRSKGEVLVFRRGHKAVEKKPKHTRDVEAGDGHEPGNDLEKMQTDESAVIQEQTSIFHWKDVCYDIKIKGEPRRILDHVDGWVRPGTLTALMGESGAGKTTLLDALASRTTTGVISGSVFVDGRRRDTSFQRKTGYVQQQDLHLSTSTVREALNFSALLRQPGNVPRQEKLDYVDEVIKLLDMQEYADAVVGVPGEGLNVEQRKRLTIGVELAARPQLLLFLDEPTSGLDSQTSWAICDLMEKLTAHGTAILCTIHQPSAMLFQRFDRLLLLQKGGQTVYFGDIGRNAAHMTDYFQRHGASPCPPDGNPAEWMLQVIGAAPGSKTDKDWHKAWRDSPELAAVHTELKALEEERPQVTKPFADPNDKLSYREFAAPFKTQMWEVQKRVFEQYWRTPSYIYSKALLCIASSLFIGFSFFKAGTSQQSLQNQMFSIFMIFILFGNLVQQIMPNFVVQRALYESRERPSKTYDWRAFMLSNIIAEIPWSILMGAAVFFCYYYPVGLYKNAFLYDQVHERGALFFLLTVAFLLFTSTFAHMIVAAIEDAETAGNLAQLLFSLTLIFCGVLAGPSTLPGFWIFMYDVSPFRYLVGGMLSAGVANTRVECAPNEFISFQPPPGTTCGNFTAPIQLVGGYLEPSTASLTAPQQCSYCQLNSTNQFLELVSYNYGERWRDFGIMWERLPKHLVVTEHYVSLERKNARAISYAWGVSPREKKVVGHYEDGVTVNLELGADWNTLDFMNTLHGLCNPSSGNESSDMPEYCWIDQLCIRQNDSKELRQTLARIPDIFRSLDVVVLLPGARCECGLQRLQRFQRRRRLRRKRGFLQLGWCWNSVSLLTWISRIWTRQEFLYAVNARFIWVDDGLAQCPSRTSDDSDVRHDPLASAGIFRGQNMLAEERARLSSSAIRLLDQAATDSDDADRSMYIPPDSDVSAEQADLMISVMSVQERFNELIALRLGYHGLVKSAPISQFLENMYRLLAGEESRMEQPRRKNKYLNDDFKYDKFAVAIADMYTSSRSATKPRDVGPMLHMA